MHLYISQTREYPFVSREYHPEVFDIIWHNINRVRTLEGSGIFVVHLIKRWYTYSTTSLRSIRLSSKASHLGSQDISDVVAAALSSGLRELRLTGFTFHPTNELTLSHLTILDLDYSPHQDWSWTLVDVFTLLSSTKFLERLRIRGIVGGERLRDHTPWYTALEPKDNGQTYEEIIYLPRLQHVEFSTLHLFMTYDLMRTIRFPSSAYVDVRGSIINVQDPPLETMGPNFIVPAFDSGSPSIAETPPVAARHGFSLKLHLTLYGFTLSGSFDPQDHPTAIPHHLFHETEWAPLTPRPHENSSETPSFSSHVFLISVITPSQLINDVVVHLLHRFDASAYGGVSSLVLDFGGLGGRGHDLYRMLSLQPFGSVKQLLIRGCIFTDIFNALAEQRPATTSTMGTDQTGCVLPRLRDLELDYYEGMTTPQDHTFDLDELRRSLRDVLELRRQRGLGSLTVLGQNIDLATESPNLGILGKVGAMFGKNTTGKTGGSRKGGKNAR